MFFFLMIRRPPRSTRTDHSFPTRRSSDLGSYVSAETELFRIADPSVVQAEVSVPVSEGAHIKPGAPAVIEAEGNEISARVRRSEEHTSELQSLMRISYAVFCLKKKSNSIERPHTQE